MTYCYDFFKKFKKEGNFCGLDKSQVSRLTAYLEIVEMLMKQKIPEEQIYENFTVGAATPLIAAKEEARADGVNFVISRLKENKKVRVGEIQATLKSCKFATFKTPDNDEKDKKHNEVKQLSKAIASSNEVMETVPDPVDAHRLSSIAKEGPIERPPETPPVPQIPPCRGGGGCQRGKFVENDGKGRGAVCDAIGAPINQLPGNICPYDAKLTRVGVAVDTGFRTGTGKADIISAAGSRPVDSLIQRDRTLTITFDPGQWETLKNLQRAGQADGFEEAVKACVDEVGRRGGGS